MLSEKQKAILAFPYTKYTALICDGAVRSGKTSLMMVAFIDWAMSKYKNTRLYQTKQKNRIFSYYPNPNARSPRESS